MSTIIYVQGALEPIELSEPFQATVTNLGAALRTGTTFFVGNLMNGDHCAIHVPNITHIVEVEGEYED